MLTASELIIRHPRQLDTAWAQRIVSHYAPLAQVSTVQIQKLDVGTTTRVQLYVEHDAPLQLPKQWFVKLPSLSWRAKAVTLLPRLLTTEIHFYQHLACLVPLDTMPVLGAASNLLGGSTLVINHVHENGGLAGKSGEALTLEQAEAVMHTLAHFHARFWNTIHQYPHLRRLDGPTRKLEDALGTLLAVPLMKRAIKKASTLISSDLHSAALNYARQRKHVMALLNQGPYTLIHRDCHPGNFFWHDNRPGFLDWQLVRIGEGVADVAYFLATALDIPLRRQYEHRLLHLYRDSLAQQGIAVDFAWLWERYRLHLCYPFEAMLLTLAIGGLMEDQANRIMIERATAAVIDHQVFDLLETKRSRTTP